MEFVIKNTFIDIAAAQGCQQEKRSSSVPPAWKPSSVTEELEARALLETVSTCGGSSVWRCDASTTDSDDTADESGNASTRERYTGGTPGSATPVTSWGDSDDEKSNTACVTSNTAAVLKVMDNSASGACRDSQRLQRPRTTKLNPQARLFQPVVPGTPVPQELAAVIGVTSEALRCSPCVHSVDVSGIAMGSTTTLTVRVEPGSLATLGSQRLLSCAKEALLGAAARSQSTYVLGYLARPFKDLGTTGFGAQVGFVTSAQEKVTCWDTYQRGFCPRRATCRWCHPLESDLIQIVVKLQEA